MRISTVATISLASLGSLASCAAIEKRDYATYKNTVRAVNMHNSTARAMNGSLVEIGTQAVVEVDVKVVANIQTITSLSANLTATVKKIQSKGLIPLSSTTFSPVVAGFKEIIAAATKASAGIEDLKPPTSPLAKGKQKNIADALTEFVKTHTVLLDVVIGKAGLLDKVGLAPVAEVLKSLELAVDKLSFSIIALIPAYSTDTTAALRSLDAKIHEAQKAFSPASLLPLPAPTILPADGTVPELIAPVTGGLPETSNLITPLNGDTPSIPDIDVPAPGYDAVGQVEDLIEPSLDPVPGDLSGNAGSNIAGDLGGIGGGISGGIAGDFGL